MTKDNTRDSALIIFVKNPEEGEVKTRLAKTIGDQKALNIYRQLLKITKSVADCLPVDKHLWYSRFIDEDDLWSDGEYKKHLQEGYNLGIRMQNAFEEIFKDEYQKAVIIGSDCGALETEILKEAFEQLDHHDVVIGPARDGGYYLLGMSTYYPELFENKTWSTSSVLQSTVEQVEAMNLSYDRMPVLNDIDTEADLHESKRLHLP